MENFSQKWKKIKNGKSLSFRKQFLIIVDYDIPRLQSIVKLALGNKRGVEYVLDKCTQRYSYQGNKKSPCTNQKIVFFM